MRMGVFKMRALLSVIGLYNWDSTIFEGFQLPEKVDKELLIENLMLELGELSLLYTEPELFKTMLYLWSKKQKPIWDKLIVTTEFEYNPIHNYDRTEIEESTNDISKEYEDNKTNKNTSNTESNSRNNTTTEENRQLRNDSNEERNLTNTGTNDITGNTTTTTTSSENTTDTRTDNLTTNSTTSSTTDTTEDGSSNKSGTENNSDTYTDTTHRTLTDDFNSKVIGTNTDNQKIAAFNSAQLKHRQEIDNTGDTTTTSHDSIAEDINFSHKGSAEKEYSERTSNTLDSTVTQNSNTDTTNTGTVKNVGDKRGTETSTGTESSLHKTSDKQIGTIENSGSETENVSGTGLNTENVTTENVINQTGTDSGNSKEKGTNNRSLHAFGNIGVTTTQQMIQAERELIESFNIYDYIIEQFKLRFCLLVY